MKVLVTGAKGFVGKNFVDSLEAVKAGKDKVHKIHNLSNPADLEIFQYDLDSSLEDLEVYCKDVDFIFHLAGVNRPKNTEEFMTGNFGFTSTLLDILKKHDIHCPFMISSSIQASLEGKYAGSVYGESKLAGEKLCKNYAKETETNMLIYRFPNLFGKGCRPNYNSAVATFCHNIANSLPIQVNDCHTMLDLVYIDAVIEELFLALNGEEHRGKDGYCYVPQVHQVTLGEIVNLLHEFHDSRKNYSISNMSEGSFTKQLYATYLSYLSPDDFSYPLKMNVDERGSFTEIIKTEDRGQFSVNISKPGITKGQHWHHTKNEKFVVVSGTGCIQLRKIGIDPQTKGKYPIVEYFVNGHDIRAVDMIPGYTHNIINLSETEDLVTFMWCNEKFNIEKPDTFFEEV